MLTACGQVNEDATDTQSDAQSDALNDADAVEADGSADTGDADSTDDTADNVAEEGLPDLSDGASDRYAANACEVLGSGTTQVVQAAARVEDAGQAIILPNDDTAFKIQLPTGQKGYVTLEIADWMTTVAFFTEYATDYAIDERAQLLTPRQWNAYCWGNQITDQRVAFHEWGPYTLEFGAEGPREAWLMIQKMQ